MASNPGATQFEANSFASAVARAKQIAARITPAAGDAQVQGIKRPLDDGASFGEPELKKSTGDSTIGAQLRAISENQPFPSQSSEAARQAHEAAARVIANRQLGGSQQQADPMMMQGGPMGGPGGMAVTEDYSVPDKMVGLIIGKGGEQITRLQAETGVKVQIAPDSGGSATRPCTLTGPQHAIDHCKQAISQIIDRGQANGGPPQGGGMDLMMSENHKTFEMMIPGGKVGLIIGKGGETIRQLQETAGVKMVMVQDNNNPSTHEKPLRISGDGSKITQAREMILSLLAEKEDAPMPNKFNEYGGSSPMGGSNSMGGPPGGMDIGVPRQGVGLVIGKGGDMIKKIQTETGAKVQFKPDDQCLPDRTCSIGGSPEKCQSAIAMINNLLSRANIPGTTMRNNSRPDMGQMGGPGPNRGGPQGGGGMGGRFDNNVFDQVGHHVPAEKCGLVIGKGGETIREINRQSGAHVELDRNPPPNPIEKVFNIRGNQSQIQHAVQLIQEKTGQHGHNDQGPGPGPGNPGMMGGPGGPNGPPGGPGSQVGPNGPGPQGPGYDQYGGQFNQPNQPPQQPYGGAPQQWNAYGNQFPQQQNMANKQTNDANAAAWAYYYAQYGQGQPGQQPATPQQPAAPQQQPIQQQPAQPYTPTINPQTHQPDYTEAWLQYYRCQGMWTEANMVLQHSQNQAAAGTAALSQGQQPGQP